MNKYQYIHDSSCIPEYDVTAVGCRTGTPSAGYRIELKATISKRLASSQADIHFPPLVILAPALYGADAAIDFLIEALARLAV